MQKAYHLITFIDNPTSQRVLDIIRENEEDLYAGIEHRQTEDVVQCLKLITRPGCEKIVRYAFEYAKAYNRKKVTCMVKDNIMKLTEGLLKKVFEEVARVLAKGGQFIFTDPMQSAKCPKNVLKPILDRIHLDSLGSIEHYQKMAKDCGLTEVEIMDLSQNLPAHYGRVLQELVAQHNNLIRVCAEEYLANMKVGYQTGLEVAKPGR